nr:ribonuclease H-like domain-containing protein [Tanacetum cinerariifolium]
MENKPNVAGSGPAWLFDIDSLSQTMNYHPVIAENQTNSNAGFQDTKKAREEGPQTYVLFPVLSDGSTNSQNNKDALVDGKEHDDDIQKSVSPDIHSSSSGAQTRKQGDKTENKDKGKSPVFCGLKGIKREFSIPRTLQQNGIAERKNKTLIEAARTLLADSLLSIPFWAEAVNTAYYVQNRVLVTKPHNKTPYELLHGRLPRKVDEGFLVGYSNNKKDALVDGKEHDDDIQNSMSPDIHSSSSGAQTRKQGD